jgi:hydroxymethylpyrimidine pyrophosphatase-like HAD family hydrolase
MMVAPCASTAIRAVVSDVDGTLVTNEKRLTKGAIRAAAKLGAAGIPFTIISSRPARGMRMLLPPLELFRFSWKHILRFGSSWRIRLG